MSENWSKRAFFNTMECDEPAIRPWYLKRIGGDEIREPLDHKLYARRRREAKWNIEFESMMKELQAKHLVQIEHRIQRRLKERETLKKNKGDGANDDEYSKIVDESKQTNDGGST